MPSQFVADAQEALEAQYEQFGVPASWAPADGGAAIPCTVIKMSPDTELRMGDRRVVAGTNTLQVRVSEVPAPARNDRVTLQDPETLQPTRTFKILADPKADDFGLEWPCEAAPLS